MNVYDVELKYINRLLELARRQLILYHGILKQNGKNIEELQPKDELTEKLKSKLINLSRAHPIKCFC